MKRVLLAAVAGLALVGAAHAEPVQVREGRFEAAVSADQMSRITIVGDKIVSIRSLQDPEGPQMLVEAEEATGDVYVAFDGPVLGRSFSLFLVTESGRTIQGDLSPAAIAGQTVTVSAGVLSSEGTSVQRTDRRAPYMETVTALMRLMFNGEAPDGVRRTSHAGRSSHAGPYELSVSESYEVMGLRGQVLTVRNGSNAAVPVLVDTFLVAGVLAVAADRNELQPGGTARVFLVEEAR